MAAKTRTVKRVCKCVNCGNEAEMEVTCTLDPDHDHPEAAPHEKNTETDKGLKHVKGVGTCSSCGNEADMWVDL